MSKLTQNEIADLLKRPAPVSLRGIDLSMADLRGADLRGANIEGVDFYLVDLREARYDPEQAEHLRRCGAILESRV